MRSTGTDRPVRVLMASNAAGAKGTGQAGSFAFNWRQEETRDDGKTVHHPETAGV